MDATYSQRLSALEPNERIWTVNGEGLFATLADRRASAWRWRELRGIRLAWAPTRLKPWRRVAAFDFGPDGTVAIDNGHFAGMGDFEDRSGAFAGFIRTAITNAAAVNPSMRCDLGAPGLSYLALLLFAVASLGALAAALVALPLPFWPWTAIVKLLIVVALVPAVVTWARRTRPRRSTVDDLLAELAKS